MVRLKDKRGLTLVEVIVVAVIVAILGAVGVPLYMGYINDAAVNQATNEAASFATALSNGISVGATAITGASLPGDIDATSAAVTITWTMPADWQGGTSPTYVVQKGIKLTVTGTGIASPGTVIATVKDKQGTTANY